MSDGSDSTAPEQPEPQGDSPPSQAVDRLKKERDDAKAALAAAEPALKQSLLIDTLYAHLGGVDKLKGRSDRYELAKLAAGQPQVNGAEDPATAAEEWITSMSTLFSSPTETKAAPPMAAGPNPAAEGLPVDEGPYKVGSKEYQEFVKTHGNEAALQAIRDNRFYFSPATVAAQETAGL